MSERADKNDPPARPPCWNGIPPCDGDCGWNPDDPDDPCARVIPPGDRA